MSDTESFEQAMDFANTVVAYCDIPLLDRLQAAHDREIRDTAQREYDRGFNDGAHSMDAEHRAVAMRLRHLPLDGGSHENLSNIARAVYHSDFGWTQGACAALRDELVRLMGGVSDDTCDSQCRGACADCDGDCGLQREEVSDGRVADDCDGDSRGGAGSELVHMAGLDEERRRVVAELRRLDAEDGKAYICGSDIAHAIGLDYGDTFLGRLAYLIGGYRPSMVTYDVLDNERRKAIAELRKMSERGNVWGRELIVALGLSINASNDDMCDRLIHLLGGDQPNGIDVLNGADLSKKSVDAMSKRAMEEREVEGRITDELREFVGTFSKRLSINVAEVNAIADRIDAQFDRICAQHEAVLQSTIDEVVEERDHLKHVAETNSNALLRISGENASLKADCEKLEKLRDRWCQQATDLMNRADDMERQCDNLLDLLRDARDEYKTLVQASAEASAHFHVMRGKVWSLEVERDELQEKLDGYDSTHVELPRDANGEVFRVGCTVKMVERHPEVLLTVHSMTLRDDGEWLLFAWDDKDEYSCNLSTLEFEVCEPKPDTAESIVRDLSMGVVTESEAIDRIEALNG